MDGVLTCDPNIYPGAEPVPYLTFDEAAELAYFGAQVFFFFSLSLNRQVYSLLVYTIETRLTFPVFRLSP